MSNQKNKYSGLEVAVIGIAGKFPKSENIKSFWENLKLGKSGISYFSNEELLESGNDENTIRRHNYVKASGYLENIDLFDANFFGYSPSEAKFLNPETRLLLETVWTALEDAGQLILSNKGKIGVYVGASTNLNWNLLCIINSEGNSLSDFEKGNLSSTDFIATQTSYKLNLKGPSIYSQSACSSSLVTLHQATRALLLGECNIAIAGGVSISSFRKEGYLYEEGMILSKDGYCRAFDKDANGTVGGNGVGAVVLKPLSKAIEDRDHIYAIIKGSAVNNDGDNKLVFSAPSIYGQAQVISDAHKFARVQPESISYIEAHGTGTKLGDPIEIEALKTAFNTEERNFCAVGSVKTNIGHLDAAAGIAGFIKTALSIKNRQIPPSLHFKEANSEIDFGNSPFYVNKNLKIWRNSEYPLRGAVSSFGIGGTNAHVILEESPKPQNSSLGRKDKLFILSAKNPNSLKEMCNNLYAFFLDNPQLNMNDAAYTLQTGRETFAYRTCFTCDTIEEGTEKLARISEKYDKYHIQNKKAKIAFMFPGQGAQYIGMAKGLYENEGLFAEVLDNCLELIKIHSGIEFRDVLFPNEITQDQNKINETQYAQPLIFAIEYSLTKLLDSWGITPKAMIGHSLGEYVAACISGVISLEDGIKLIVKRAELMQKAERGLMLSVGISLSKLKLLISNELSVAAINGPNNCVVSGNEVHIKSFSDELNSKGISNFILNTSHAYHSSLMEPILDEFSEIVKTVKITTPKISYISNLTGTWITPDELKDPLYWVKHLRNTVRFSEGVENLLSKKHDVIIEVGPGNSLTKLVKQHIGLNDKIYTVNTLRHPLEKKPDSTHLTNAIGELWLFGVDINWKSYYKTEQRNKISLPTYSFNRISYWFDKDLSEIQSNLSTHQFTKKQLDISKWFYTPTWYQSYRLQMGSGKKKDKTWLFFSDIKYAKGIVQALEADLQNVIQVKVGTQFKKLRSNLYEINPESINDYNLLFGDLKKQNAIPDCIANLWSISDPKHYRPCIDTLNDNLNVNLFSILLVAKAIGHHNITQNIEFKYISNNVYCVKKNEKCIPEKATSLGAMKIIPLEYKNIRCCSIDFSWEEPTSEITHLLLEELKSDISDIVVSYRNKQRWALDYKEYYLPENLIYENYLKEKGTYIILGGFGGMGLIIANFLATEFKANIIIVGRSKFPEKNEWEKIRSENTDKRKIDIINRLIDMEIAGGNCVYYNADISNLREMKYVFDQSITKFGSINGIIHAAGEVDYGGIIQQRDKESICKYMSSKVLGTLVINELIKNIDIDFVLFFSSLGNVLYQTKFGQVSYSASNEYLESFSDYLNNQKGIFSVCVNWDDWAEVGMSYQIASKEGIHLQNGIKSDEGVEIFKRLFSSPTNRISVSTTDLTFQIKNIKNAFDKNRTVYHENSETVAPVKLYERPEISSKYVKPSNEIEIKLVKIWETIFGYDKIGIEDDFFEMGGDSLKAVSLLMEVNKIFKIKLQLAVLFNITKIKDFSKYLSSQIEDGTIRSERSELSENLFLLSNQKQYYIENTEKKLYSVLHCSKNDTKKGIVLCPPIGQEYIRSYMFYKKLAEKLTTKDFYALRFDYSGMGESSGKFENASVASWINDIHLAVCELRKEHGIDEIYLLGSRFGATLSILYQQKENVDGLILLSPVLKGSEYLKELNNLHKIWLSSSFAKQKKNKYGAVENLGFLYSRSLIKEIKSINLSESNLNLTSRALIVNEKDTNLPVLSKSQTVKSIEGQKFWVKTDRKPNLPMNEMNAIIDWI